MKLNLWSRLRKSYALFRFYYIFSIYVKYYFRKHFRQNNLNQGIVCHMSFKKPFLGAVNDDELHFWWQFDIGEILILNEKLDERYTDIIDM